MPTSQSRFLNCFIITLFASFAITNFAKGEELHQPLAEAIRTPGLEEDGLFLNDQVEDAADGESLYVLPPGLDESKGSVREIRDAYGRSIWVFEQEDGIRTLLPRPGIDPSYDSEVIQQRRTRYAELRDSQRQLKIAVRSQVRAEREKEEQKERSRLSSLSYLGGLGTYRPTGLIYVQGYTRRDGTYVRGHFRTRPDGNPFNNLSR